MKKIHLFSLITSVLLLASCSWNNPQPTSSGSSTSSSGSSTSQTTGSTTGSSTSGSTSHTSTGSTTGSTSTGPKPTGKIDIGFSCINDFHGAINQTTGQPGLAKVATYLKQKKAAGNILINSGDMWQGTFESNYNAGELVTKAFKDIGFDANTIGNHEFDWKVNRIEANELIYGEDFLCANIYSYNSTGNPSYVGERYSLGKDFKIVEKNGVRVGIIGVIGKDQFSSIDSQNTKDFVFVDPTDVVKNISQDLRQNYNCQVVVASYHAGEGDVNASILNFDSTGHRYVDAVFCAHTHQAEYSIKETTYNDVTTYVPFIQSGTNGWYCGNVTLTYDWDNDISTLNEEVTTWNESITNSSVSEDPTVKALVNEYNAISSAAGSVYLGSTSGAVSKSTAARMTAKGMYDLCMENGESDVVLTMTNTARNAIETTDVYMRDAITCIPFDNQIVVCSVCEDDLAKEIGYSSTYIYNPTHISFDPTGSHYYKVAICSYMAYHTGTSSNYYKQYNYFPSITNISELTDSHGDLIYYREGLLKQFKDSSGNYGQYVDLSYYSGADYQA